MATVWVTREELAGGEFPAVCAITGGSADARLPMTFSHLPSWAWVLLPFGLPFLLAAAFGAEKVPSQLPVVAHAVEAYRRVQGLSTALSAVGALVAIGGMLSTSLTGVAAGLMSLAAGVVAGLSAAGRIPDGRPDDTGLWVKLVRVHPNFVSAVEAGGRAPS